MAATPEDMQAQMAQDAPVAQAGTPSAVPSPTPAAPASQPAQASGNKMVAQIRIQTALQLLQSALPHYDVGTREGKALMAAIQKLGTSFGSPSEAQSLIPAQILELAKTAQQKGAAPLTQ